MNIKKILQKKGPEKRRFLVSPKWPKKSPKSIKNADALAIRDFEIVNRDTGV